MLVSVWLTVTVTLLVTDRLPLSVIVAIKVYVPAALNVTVVSFTPLVPLRLKTGAAGAGGVQCGRPSVLQIAFAGVIGTPGRTIVPWCPSQHSLPRRPPSPRSAH